MFFENCTSEWFLAFSGIGVSIFTTKNPRKEHIYCGVSDSPALWEVNIGHKWKILTLELASWIEDKYRLHYKKCQLKDYIHTDFEKMFMLKPFFAELRRTYTPGIYIQYRKSRSYEYLDIKIQSLQIDNKQPTSSNSILLYPLPTESIRSQDPFVELSILRSSFKNYHIYKYIKINVRDFYLNIEDGVFLDLNKLFIRNGRFVKESIALYRTDMSYIHAPANCRSQVSILDHYQTPKPEKTS